ncbi:MAG: DEAD/DEAH box helicase [Flavobacteriales bacterium]|tara:strand:- start:1819 stop:3702 length:1884 start_codon:yes stop_codon:yes gene_type:complete
MKTFQELGLNEALLKAIEDMGFEHPSEVQEKAIPILLEKDTDIVSLAQTGTGKTAAFGFPMLQKIDPKSKTTQGLILSPTRELCLQITQEIKNYSKHIKGVNVVAIYGGASITDQARAVKKGAQILVATPGRMQDMIRRRLVNVSKIEYCVLDEADEMLNMGFFEDITEILSHTPDEKNTWLFSATMPKEVSVIAKKFMHNPEEITVGTRNAGTKNVSHEYYKVSGRDRYPALRRLADAHPDIFSVVFCRTKRDTQSVAEKLIEDGYNAGALHGDLSQNQRDLVMKSFRNKQIQMLVATDVAARGIDVDNITHVIHYQLPDEIETYTHRSGRTGRAGNQGISMIIVTQSESRKIRAIEKKIQLNIEMKKIPTGMEICETQLYSLAQKIKNTTVNEDIFNYLPKVEAELEDLSKEELIQRLVSVEFARFHNYYKKSKDLNSKFEDNPSEKTKHNKKETTRYFINVGERDDYNWMALKDFLKSTLEIDTDDIFHVDVMESFSFFNTPNSLQEKVLEKFTDFQLNGRYINVEVSEKAPRGRSGGGGGGKRKSFNKGGSSSGGGGYNKKSNSSGGSGGGGYDRGKRRSFDNNPDKKREESSSSPRRSSSGSKPAYGAKSNKPGGFGRRSRN